MQKNPFTTLARMTGDGDDDSTIAWHALSMPRKRAKEETKEKNDARDENKVDEWLCDVCV